MILKNYNIFKESKIEDIKRPWIYNGNFSVKKSMILDGRLIKEHIPDEVVGNFYCSNLELTSLEGCPTKVGKDFDCSYNLLISLEGCSISVGENFDCSYNKLKILEKCPINIGNSFYCSNNNLTSLKGSPINIHRSFTCHHNFLTSLEGSPVKIGRDFDCSHNLLTSLKGNLELVKGSFYCINNYLTSLEDIPKVIGNDISCFHNKADLKIEEKFIHSTEYKGNKNSNYWIDLLKYMIKEKIDFDKVTGWPEGFVTDELIQSIKGIKKYNLFESSKHIIKWETESGDKYVISDKNLKITFHFDEFEEDEFEEDLIDPISNKSHSSNYSIYLDEILDLSNGNNEFLLSKIKYELLKNNVIFEFDFNIGKLSNSTTIVFDIDFKATLEKLLKEDPNKIYTIDWPENILPKDKNERENVIQSMIGIKKYML